MSAASATWLATVPGRADSTGPLVGTVLAGTWRLEELLGAGGQASVYRASCLDTANDPTVCAMKVCEVPEHRDRNRTFERFRREGELLSRIGDLRHCSPAAASFIRCFGQVGLEDGRPALLLEYIPGRRTARHVLGLDGPPWSRGSRVAFVARVARAVAFLHGLEIWHLDLTPQNILCHGASPLICDFGAAHFANSGKTVCYTPGWCAPEQAAARLRIPAAADVWTVGLLIWLACRDAGESTPEDTDDEEVAELARRDLDGSPVQELVLSCLELDPTARPSSATVAQAVERLYGHTA